MNAPLHHAGRVTILVGDVRERLRELSANSFDCVVTSPPYWGLRDYGVAGQIGLEPTLGEHLDVMVNVFREVRRVMKPSGTLWLNYGDCYATTVNGRSAADTKAAGNDDRTFRDKPFSTIGPIFQPDRESGSRVGTSGNKGHGAGDHNGRIVAGGVLKPKDLCMIPNRLAIALQDDGWWVRSEIIWHKPNPMPESITDRPASAHEKVWLLTKSARYWYDAEAVRENLQESSAARLAQDVDGQQGSVRANGGRKTNGSMKAVGGPRKRGMTSRHALHPNTCDQSGLDNVARGEGRNARNVWTIATQPFSEAHFATFPPELAERCIKAGCPASGHVLDPFGGAGTVGLVADRLGRQATLIELNSEYADIACNRLLRDAGMFASVSVNSTAGVAA